MSAYLSTLPWFGVEAQPAPVANDASPDLRHLLRAVAQDLAIMASVEARDCSRHVTLMAAMHLCMVAADMVEPGIAVDPHDFP